MKNLIILFSISMLLSSCIQRDEEKDKIIEIQRQELLEAIALDRKLKEPENITKPFVTRTYQSKQGTILVIEPKDIIYSSEISFSSRLKENQLIIPNAFYWMPSRDFIEKKLLPAWREHLRKDHVKYGTKYVCHNFSNDFCVFSQYMYTYLVINKQASGITVAEIYYFPQDAMTEFIQEALRLSPIPYKNPLEVEQQHAINMIILDDGGTMFVEPQNGWEVFLTDDEKRNITFCKF